jgi:hypothetical protein
MKNIVAILTLSFFTLLSCEEKLYDDSEFFGKWRCIEYIEMGESQKILGDHITFHFLEDNTYEYKGGSYKEAGTWKLKGNLLVTQVEGRLEKPVEIESKTADKIVLKMVDNGVPVKMILEPIQ